ncbi:DUF2059 domain-containing protein [Sphingopyxis sp. QXT-31]|uniref:DUF2059 domain-containing protein n=1 Tax=Sphingopyxis sp. QXT-31 TaxID=1357916 RepID=UPI001E5E7582|nr:DUF2059 domain-containing protein [Sphingopyxis sp. QXT-31]
MTKMKLLLLAGAAVVAAPPALAMQKEAPQAEILATDAPAELSSEQMAAQAKAKMQKEIDEAIKLIEKIYGVDQLPAIPPAQLTLAKKTTGALVPTGSLEKMMDNLYGKLFRGFLGEFGGVSDLMLSYKTGVESEKIAALDDATREKIADIFDPQRKAREEQIMANVKPIMSEVLRDLEVPMRDGMAAAFARKFSADQLTQMNAFFATPAGSAYANEWMALQADPEVMLAIIRSVPPMIDKWVDRAPELEGKFKDLPKEKQLTDLSDAELTKLAGLLQVDVQTLKDQRDLYKSVDDAAMEATDAAEAAIAAGEASDAAMAEGDYGPWYERENWSAEDLAKVEAIEAESNEIFGRSMEAQQAAIDNARKRLAKEGASPSE